VQYSGRLIFMDFVLSQVNQVKVVFTQLLKMAQIFIADRMAFLKGSAFELSRTNLGDIMGQLRSHRIP
jgi:hypothetical protein